MTERTVLISGAGIAGPTLAYWLARQGYRPTLVEQAAAQRSSGSPIDVHGPALELAERMHIVPQLQAAATRVRELVFVNAAGAPVGRMAVQPASGGVELPRADLATILQNAARAGAEFLYGDTIRTLQQDAGGVDVTFEHTAPRRFDLVIGADGTHSGVRRLAFGPERDFVQHAGMYVATVPLQHGFAAPHEVLMYNMPGRALAVHPARGRALAAFIFRGAELPESARRDPQQHKALLARAYARAGWRVPELLAEALASDDLYFDSVCRVRIARWSAGRIALLGDAASSVSLFGDGSSSAMVGAFTLARALAAHAGDHTSAFAAYEREHRRHTERKQRSMWLASSWLVPSTQVGIGVRNWVTRLGPLKAAVVGTKRKLTAELGRCA